MASAMIHQNLLSIAKSEARRDWRFQERQLIEARLTIKETGERFRGFVPRGATVMEAIETIAKQNGGKVIKKYYSNMDAFEIVGIRIGRTILMKNEKEGIHWFIGENKIPIVADKNGNIYILNGKEMKINEKTYDISVAMESSTLDPKNLKELTRKDDVSGEIRKIIECAHANTRENTPEVYEEKILLFDKDSGELRFLSEYNNKAESFEHDSKFNDFGVKSYYLQPLGKTEQVIDFRYDLPERAINGMYYLELLGCKVKVVDRIKYEEEYEGPIMLRDRDEGVVERYTGTTELPHSVEGDQADCREKSDSDYYKTEEIKPKRLQELDILREEPGTHCNKRKNAPRCKDAKDTNSIAKYIGPSRARKNKTEKNIDIGRLNFFKEKPKENNENAEPTKTVKIKRKPIDTQKEKFICKREKGLLHRIERSSEKQNGRKTSSVPIKSLRNNIWNRWKRITDRTLVEKKKGGRKREEREEKNIRIKSKKKYGKHGIANFYAESKWKFSDTRHNKKNTKGERQKTEKQLKKEKKEKITEKENVRITKSQRSVENLKKSFEKHYAEKKCGKKFRTNAPSVISMTALTIFLFCMLTSSMR